MKYRDRFAWDYGDVSCCYDKVRSEYIGDVYLTTDKRWCAEPAAKATAFFGSWRDAKRYVQDAAYELTTRLQQRNK